jgi:hypothetical protein
MATPITVTALSPATLPHLSLKQLTRANGQIWTLPSLTTTTLPNNKTNISSGLFKNQLLSAVYMYHVQHAVLKYVYMVKWLT